MFNLLLFSSLGSAPSSVIRAPKRQVCRSYFLSVWWGRGHGQNWAITHRRKCTDLDMTALLYPRRTPSPSLARYPVLAADGRPRRLIDSKEQTRELVTRSGSSEQAFNSPHGRIREGRLSFGQRYSPPWCSGLRVVFTVGYQLRVVLERAGSIGGCASWRCVYSKV